MAMWLTELNRAMLNKMEKEDNIEVTIEHPQYHKRIEIYPHPYPSPEAKVDKVRDTVSDWLYANSVLLLVVTGTITWKSIIQPFVQSLMFRINYSRSQDNFIREAMARIQAYTNADRVLLCQFVNRSLTNAGQPVYEMVVSHEVTKMLDSKVMPYGNYSGFGCVNHIIKSLNEQSFQKKEISSIQDSDYRSYLANLNVSFVVYRYIISQDTPIGFIVLHYCNPAHKIDWAGVNENDIAPESDRILFILKRSSSLLNVILSRVGFH